MSNRQLIIGNKNYSSWSLRPWYFMRMHEIPFEEIRIPLYAVDSAERIAKYSPSGLVPALIDDGLHVWDSLAICEYVSEAYLDGAGWPSARAARARARSVSAEMHAGFSNIRSNLSMNVRARFQWQFIDESVERELQRIKTIWNDCRAEFGGGGPWLFGEFSIADAMYVPVCLRLQNYNVPLEGAVRDYVRHVLASSAMMAWCEEALREKEVIAWAENAKLPRIEKG